MTAGCLRIRLAALATVTVLALALVACGDDDASQPDPTGASATEPATPLASTDIDPATGLPRSFPDDFPVLADTSVFRASEYSDRYVIEWRSEGRYEEAMTFYEEALDAAPWEIESSAIDEAAAVFDFTGGSGEEFTGSLAVAPLEEGARILLNLIRS